ncbi:MAG: hypothetical protein MUF48_07320 [Pirellulaceae bacterium]|nr:hypothetical protein [Pirellulaceae bacterium]
MRRAFCHLLVCLLGLPWCANVARPQVIDEPMADVQPIDDIQVDHPLTAAERAAAARLTRLPGARLSWNKKNRIVAVSLKGNDANDHALALASRLPGLRAVVVVAEPRSQLTNNGLAPLTALPDLELLSVTGDRVSDAALQHVGQLPKLRTLVLNTNITDAGLDMLAGLTRLEQLDLSQTRITDVGIANLTNYPNLHTLILNSTAITNEALETIAGLKTIQKLYLGNTAVDDGAIESLQQMEQLRLLFLLDTPITPAGIEQLQPFLSIEWCTIIHQSGKYQGTRRSPVAMRAPPTQPARWRPAR